MFADRRPSSSVIALALAFLGLWQTSTGQPGGSLAFLAAGVLAIAKLNLVGKLIGRDVGLGFNIAGVMLVGVAVLFLFGDYTERRHPVEKTQQSRSIAVVPAKPDFSELSPTERVDRKKALLAQLEGLPSDAAEKISAVYRELSILYPQDSGFAQMAEHFHAVYIEQKAKITIAKAKAEEHEKLRLMGRVWTYQTSKDDMTGGLIRQAVLSSKNLFNLDFPYEGAQRARLIVRSHPRWGLNVLIEIHRGQFACVLNGCNVLVRFDDGAIETFSVSAPSSMETTARFIDNAQTFLAQLRRSKSVSIEATFYQAGVLTLQFESEGLEWS